MPPPNEPDNSQRAPVPPAVLEFLANMLAQNGSLSFPTSQPPTPPVASSTLEVPSTPSPVVGRVLDRPGCGQGGVLAEKERVSKEIKGTSAKRKSLVDPEIETSPPTAPNHPGKATGPKTGAKRLKTNTKGPRRHKQSPPASQGSAEARSDLNLPAVGNNQPLSHISTPTPPRAVSHQAKSRAATRLPPPSIVEVPSDNDNEHLGDNNDPGAENGSDHWDPEVEVSASALNHAAPAPTPYAPALCAGLPTMPTGPPINLLHTFLAQLTSITPAVAQLPSPTTVQSQGEKKLPKGVKAYPDGWRKILNNAKDIARSGLLLKQPFPTSKNARISVTEAFHEAHTFECTDGMIPESNFSFDKNMMKVLLDEMSTSRSDLKKLAKILVAADPGIFASPENTFESHQTATQIRTIAGRVKKPPIPSAVHQPSDIRASIAARLARFAFLNDPPTATGTLLANPIFGALCRSFYEEEKWKNALSVELRGDDEWTNTVTVTMASFAATSYYAALEEWKTGRFIRKQFEAEKYGINYREILEYITSLISDDPEAGAIDNRFKSWATESVFVQDLYEVSDNDE